jgi:hypothetical protein
MPKVSDMRIIRLFMLGWPPSQIDRKLGTDNAHDVIVKHWVKDDMVGYLPKEELIWVK